MLDLTKMHEIAQSLRDDPSFETMSVATVQTEVRDMLRRYNVEATTDTIQEVVDYAGLLEPTPPATGLRYRAHIPGQQAAMEAEQAKAAAPAPPKNVIVAQPGETVSISIPYEAPAPRIQEVRPVISEPQLPRASAMPLLYRVKAITGLADATLAEMLDMKRSTIQSYVAGRVPETLTKSQVATLVDFLDAKKAEINQLIRDIA